MALAALLARAAEGHALKERHVIADLSGLADDHTHAVVNEQARTDGCAGMDLDTGKEPGKLRQGARDKGNAFLPEPMGKPVEQERVNSRVREGDLDPARCGGIHGKGRLEVFLIFWNVSVICSVSDRGREAWFGSLCSNPQSAIRIPQSGDACVAPTPGANPAVRPLSAPLRGSPR